MVLNALKRKQTFFSLDSLPTYKAIFASEGIPTLSLMPSHEAAFERSQSIPEGIISILVLILKELSEVCIELLWKRDCRVVQL